MTSRVISLSCRPDEKVHALGAKHCLAKLKQQNFSAADHLAYSAESGKDWYWR